MKLVYVMLSCFLLLVFLAGCSGTIATELSPHHEKIKNYELKNIKSTPVHGDMINYYSSNVVKGFTPRDTYYPRFQNQRFPPLEPNQVWGAYFEYKDYYVISSKEYNEYGFGFLVNEKGELRERSPLISLIVAQHIGNPLNRPIPGTYTFNVLGIDHVNIFEPTEHGTPHSRLFKYKLIYNGITNGMVMLTYKEYQDDVNKPSHQRDIIHNVNEKILEINHFKIEIINANEYFIYFIVLKDGDEK